MTHVSGSAAFQAAFRFASTEGREAEAGLCTPANDAMVTAWAEPLRTAGVAIMPAIQGQVRHSNWTTARLDESFFVAAVSVAKHFGFAGWTLDVEGAPGALGNCVSPSDPSSGARCAAEYAAFLAVFGERLGAHGMRLASYEPNGFTEGKWSLQHRNYSGYVGIGHSGAEILTMDTYCAHHFCRAL